MGKPTPKKEVQSSPLPPKTAKMEKEEGMTQMSFPDAIKAVISGYKVTRVEWGNDEEYGLLTDGFLRLRKPIGTVNGWLVSEGDILATDWVIVTK